MATLGSYPRNSSIHSYAPHKAYCPLSNGSEFATVGILNRNGKTLA